VVTVTECDVMVDSSGGGAQATAGDSQSEDAVCLALSCLEGRGLFDAGECADLGFEGLVVLALDLEFGLEFLDEQVEARDFHTEFVQVSRTGGWAPGRQGLGLLRNLGESWRRFFRSKSVS
jgi:hypothetical protein